MKHTLNRSFVALMLLGLVACAAPQPTPRGAEHVTPQLNDDTFVASDGMALPLRTWLPVGSPVAVVVALHGINDYSRAFALPAEYMRVHGVAVYSYDQRGFGHAPNHGAWAGGDSLAEDAVDMLRVVRVRYPNTPLFLMGESMGGALAVITAARPDLPPIQGVILSAPAVWGGDTMNGIFRASLWALVHTVPDKQLTGDDLHILATDNIDLLRVLGRDPYIIKGSRVDTIYGLVQVMDEAYAEVPDIRVPTLLLYGAHDEVIPPHPIANSLRRSKRNQTVAAYYPGGYHMLMRDLHGDIVVRDILSWIGDPARPLPSGYQVDSSQFNRRPHVKPASDWTPYRLRRGDVSW